MFNPPFYDNYFFLIPLFSQLFYSIPPFPPVPLWAKKDNSFTETTLETWFPWQQVKVYPQTFDFETFSINIGERSQILKKIAFVAQKLLRKLKRRVKNTPMPYRVNVRREIKCNFFL